MNIVKNFITSSAFAWAEKEKQDANSLAGFIIRYMEQVNKLRDAQQEALKVYLWLKCEANNVPLVNFFADRYPDHEGSSLKTLLFDLAEEIQSDSLKKYVRTATENDIKNFFMEFFSGYDDTVTVLFSLPMGAGKTYVMAAMIYIDQYFNLTNDDKRFAKNYLIFAPSGLKNSVIPSLRSIEKFDPSWILPEDIAGKIKQQLKFIVLDVNKTEKKSNRIENPNARKVQECLNQLNPSGYIFVTNAEKVILDKIVEDPYKNTLFEQTDDEKSTQANELRHLLGKIPALTILMDEVHHNQKEENKLRLVINNHFKHEKLVSVMGFTGTPYFKRKLTIQTIVLQLDQIPNTVYHYELKNGVRNFLKQPLIKSFTSDTESIIRAGLEDFYNRYYTKTFHDGTKPKIAIYCATIEKLTDQILPIVIDFYQQKGLDTNEILKYYGEANKKIAGKTYILEKDAEIEFQKLDTPYSSKRVVLLCQIGKEGWNCKSLCGVILSSEGDSPKNMVLQTSCRCLREVDDAENEIGLIYVNQSNYKHLESELLYTHKISIKEFEEGHVGAYGNTPLQRVDRRTYLQLPEITYNQLKVSYECITQEENFHPREKLQDLIQHIRNKEQPYYKPQITTTRTGFELYDRSEVSITPLTFSEVSFSFAEFVSSILKSSFGVISSSLVTTYNAEIQEIYNHITQFGNFVDGFDLSAIISAIHQACLPPALVSVHETIDNKTVAWLIDDVNKNVLSDKAKIYPDNKDFINKIDDYDQKKIDPDSLTRQEDAKIKQLEETKQMLSGNPDLVKTLTEQIDKIKYSKLPIKSKDVSFHYIPYDFTQSNFEQQILEKIFQLQAFQERALEVYFNGDRFLSKFNIKIYKKIGQQWKLIQDKYTPDFLIIKRNKKNKIAKVLIIETKGAHLAQDFRVIRDFMEGKFIEINQGLFDYLYLEDGNELEYHVQKIHDKMSEYFR